VSNLSAATTKETLHEFFSFCGTITDIELKEKTATVSFEKPSAAKTALMLNDGTLDGSELRITSDIEHEDRAPSPTAPAHPIEQTDKPRAGIAAEYLAKGYVLGDHILHRAIEIDKKQGISAKFQNYIKQLDHGVGHRTLGPDQTVSGKVTSTVKELDEKKKFSQIANDYYEKAISSPFGQRVLAFYSSTSKQIFDIHEEARRIADAHKQSQPPQPASSSGPAASADPVPEKAKTD
ncbi:uncharacterized protein EI90DRAFT_2914835, partial [Cantharellus anzutake]|uniref:uncharacterized protein n=1 Tax=Cantharellus anzutake TaxID=1750568 RepID=UPI001906822F